MLFLCLLIFFSSHSPIYCTDSKKKKTIMLLNKLSLINLLLLISILLSTFFQAEASFCCCHDLRGTRIASSCNYLRTSIACEAAGLTYYTGLLGMFQGCDLEELNTFDPALKDKHQNFYRGCTTLGYKCYL